MVPLLFPSVDMEVRSVSMASWFVFPSRDSAFTAISWSLTRSRPSWRQEVRQEVREEVREEVRQEVRQEVKQEVTLEAIFFFVG